MSGKAPLGHGSTKWTGADFQPRPLSELRSLVEWAQTMLAPELGDAPELLRPVDLGARKSNLGAAYAAGTAAAIWYPSHSIPRADTLEADAIRFASLLGRIYEAQDFGRAPESESPEIDAVTQVVSGHLSPRTRRGGQGYGLNTAERRRSRRGAWL